MSKWLPPRLKKRIQVVKPTQTPNSSGGFDRDYETLLTIWGELKPLSYVHSAMGYIRGGQLNEDATHKVVVRKSAVSTIGQTFSSAFTTDFDSIVDITLLKSDFFLFIQKDSTVKGRLLEP